MKQWVADYLIAQQAALDSIPIDAVAQKRLGIGQEGARLVASP